MDCRVVVEAAVPVYDVASPDEAVRIAISKTGGMLNPDLNYVEIDTHDRTCPDCGRRSEPAFVAADEGLVALELEMRVFNVEREEHAARIARKEIGQRLADIPLSVISVDPIDEEGEPAEVETEEGSETEQGNETADPAGGSAEDDVLPEFDDLIE